MLFERTTTRWSTAGLYDDGLTERQKSCATTQQGAMTRYERRFQRDETDVTRRSVPDDPNADEKHESSRVGSSYSSAGRHHEEGRLGL